MKNILVAIDFSDLSSPTCRLACDLAKRMNAVLHILHVADPDPDFVGYEAGPQEVRDTRAEHLREYHRQLEKLKQECTAEGVETHIHQLEGTIANTILETATTASADLIVLGSHGHGALHNTLLGSVSHAVLKRATMPVLFLPAKSV
jgi:nucleotide-binding universal stress UspA family protein